MDTASAIEILTLVLAFASTIIMFLVRARLIEQGKDITELKASAQIRKDK